MDLVLIYIYIFVFVFFLNLYSMMAHTSKPTNIELKYIDIDRIGIDQYRFILLFVDIL